MLLHPTGVPIIDLVLGGVAPGLPCVLSGASGSGRSVLSAQIASAALAQGRVAAFVCNEPPAFLLQQTCSLGFDFEPAVRSGQLLLLELDPGVSQLTRAHGLEAFVAAIKREEPLVSTLVVDPFTALTPDIHDEAGLRVVARRFLEACGPMDLFLTLEAERLALQPGLQRVLSEVCGSLIQLERDPSGRRRLAVFKTRSGVGSVESVEFSIGPGGATASDRIEPVREIAREASPQTNVPRAADAAPGRRDVDARDDRAVVLIVDPDPTSRDQLRGWLEDRFDVVPAADGFEAMTTILNRRPDLVILDFLRAKTHGYDLLGAFRRAADWIPRLVITEGFVRPGDRIGPLVLGATDVISRPIERFEILHKIDLLLKLSGPLQPAGDVADAEALFGSTSETCLLERAPFCERLERAFRFGNTHGLPSSLITVAANSGPELDHFVETAASQLRFEDAIHLVSKRRAVVLLTATDPAVAPTVIERVQARLDEERGVPVRLRVNIRIAEPLGCDTNWSSLFSGSASGVS